MSFKGQTRETAHPAVLHPSVRAPEATHERICNVFDVVGMIAAMLMSLSYLAPVLPRGDG
jgi:hypothetical protein